MLTGLAWDSVTRIVTNWRARRLIAGNNKAGRCALKAVIRRAFHAICSSAGRPPAPPAFVITSQESTMSLRATRTRSRLISVRCHSVRSSVQLRLRLIRTAPRDATRQGSQSNDRKANFKINVPTPFRDRADFFTRATLC